MVCTVIAAATYCGCVALQAGLVTMRLPVAMCAISNVLALPSVLTATRRLVLALALV